MISKMLLSKKRTVPFLLITGISIALLFFPLIGTLGFEFSVIIAFIGAFISVFISAEYIVELRTGPAQQESFSSKISSIIIANLILLLCPFIAGLVGSVIKGDCFIKEGAAFYLLIPVITVFFSLSLAVLIETLLPRKGFFLGALVLLGTVLFSLWRLYEKPSLFSYNPAFGFFPGPIYDEVIPITTTLVLYRISIFCWGLFFLLLSSLIFALRRKDIKPATILALAAIALVLLFFILNKERLGFTYSRSYITENFLEGKLETEHFIIYYPPGTQTAKSIKLIAEDHEWRYHQLEDFLKVTSKDKIRSYIYPDTESRKKITGAGETTLANPIHREIHLVYDSYPNPILKHELTHVMASEFGTRILKITPKIGLLEGIAVAADWSINGYSPHQWSESMLKLGTAPDIKDIIGFGFWYAAPQKSYTLMGSFCRYLIDTYGIEKFKILYRTGDFSVYSKSFDEIISGWKAFLETISIPKDAPALTKYKFSAPSIFQGKCPRKIAALKERGYKAFKDENYYEAKKQFVDALSYDEYEPTVIQSLAYSCYYDKDYSKLAETMDKKDFLTEVDKNILENLRGNALWQSGKSEEAKSIFETLSKRSLPADLRREVEIKLTSIAAGGGIESAIREYFGTKNKVTQVSVLEEAINSFPDYAPSYYLLGRLLFGETDYEKASKFLSKSELLGFKSENIRKENSRILGISLYSIGSYDEAIKSFERLLNEDPQGALKDYAQDFIDRCNWAKKRQLN